LPRDLSPSILSRVGRVSPPKEPLDASSFSAQVGWKIEDIVMKK